MEYTLNKLNPESLIICDACQRMVYNTFNNQYNYYDYIDFCDEKGCNYKVCGYCADTHIRMVTTNNDFQVCLNCAKSKYF